MSDDYLRGYRDGRADGLRDGFWCGWPIGLACGAIIMIVTIVGSVVYCQ